MQPKMKECCNRSEYIIHKNILFLREQNLLREHIKSYLSGKAAIDKVAIDAWANELFTCCCSFITLQYVANVTGVGYNTVKNIIPGSVSGTNI